MIKYSEFNNYEKFIFHYYRIIEKFKMTKIGRKLYNFYYGPNYDWCEVTDNIVYKKPSIHCWINIFRMWLIGYKPLFYCFYHGEDTFIFETKKEASSAYWLIEKLKNKIEAYWYGLDQQYDVQSKSRQLFIQQDKWYPIFKQRIKN